ncbi:MAG TPA: hypothetical protein VGF15_00185 [Solirubrobacteraceae bacterium]
MIEENETPGIDPTQGGIEHDLLAQRRARRAELSDPGLIRRAETAEATVRTLETHLASLKQRLEETTVEQRRVAEQLADREREVRRVKQREYAEQQLRVEAEDHAERLSREKRAELEELHRRLSVSEQDARELIDQLEDVRRELAEAQQVAAAERVAMGRGEQELSDREAELQRREFALEQARVETERRLSAARDFERRASALREQAQQGRDLLSGRLLALEQRTAEVQEELERQRQAREHSQLTLERARESYSGLRAIVGELERAAKQLRGAIEQERSSLAEQLERQREQLSAKHASELQNQNDQMTREHAAELHRNAQQTIDLQREREQLERRYTAELEQMRARVRELEQELEQTAAELRRHEAQTQTTPTQLSAEQTIETETAEEKRKQEMTSALAAAVERLRARAAAAGEPPAQTPTAPQQSTPVLTDTSVSAPVPNPDFATRTVLSPQRRKSWLAPAIRSLAKHGDPVKVQHAAELILELLPAQRLVFDRPLTYAGEINGVGSFIVKLEGERGTVEKVGGPPREKVDFLLKGNIEDFGELAAGGARRRRSGLKVHGSKRLARKLLASRRTPLMLSDLANAKISVWPGLLLQAMAEAIDPAWTKGQRFVVSFEIAVSRSVPIYVSVRDGEPVIVIPDWDGDPPVTVALSEYALLCLLAGVALPAGEEVRVSGQSELLGRFLDWTDRAQGLIAAG